MTSDFYPDEITPPLGRFPSVMSELSRVPELESVVREYREGGYRRHTLVTGGFGTGKSFALTQAATLAEGLGLRVAHLPHGAFGVSSYSDFVTSVARSLRPTGQIVGGMQARSGQRMAVDRSLPAMEADDGLVIVVEDFDQLFKQLRTEDRPRLAKLLDASSGPLVLGSAHGGQVAQDLRARVQAIPTQRLTVDEGIAIAVDLASRSAVVTVDPSSAVAQYLHAIDGALLANPLFWTLVGSQLGQMGAQAPLTAVDEIRRIAAVHFEGVLKRIAPSEQRVLLEIARAGAPRSVQELADSVGVRNQAAASALARLQADDWVRIAEAPAGADRRRTWYDIGDPLLRLHLRSTEEGEPGQIIESLSMVWVPIGNSSSYSLERDLDEGGREARARGKGGEPSIARVWFEHALTSRIEREGMRAPTTLQELSAWGEWMANSGERDRAKAILRWAIDDAESILGPASTQALEARMKAAWNLSKMREFVEAEHAYRIIREVAEAADHTEIAVRAWKNLGHTLGEQGDVAGAIVEIDAAIAEMQRIAATGSDDALEWPAVIRAARHELSMWRATGGDLTGALANLRELAADPDSSVSDRYSVRLDLAELEIPTRLAERVGDAFIEIAEEIENHSPNDIRLAQRARRRVLELAIDARPDDPVSWPIRQVDSASLAGVVGQLVSVGRLDLSGLEKVMERATASQTRALTAALVASHEQDLPMSMRARRARIAAEHLSGNAERRLLSDLAGALEGDAGSEANLSAEWRPMLDSMREQAKFGGDADEGERSLSIV